MKTGKVKKKVIQKRIKNNFITLPLSLNYFCFTFKIFKLSKKFKIFC